MNVINNNVNKIDDQNEKDIRFASGIISMFGCADEIGNTTKETLNFDGSFDDNGEPLKRTIKMINYVKGYDGNTKEQLFKNNYPLKENKYKAKIQVEQWEWEGHNCVRVIAFEIQEDLGPNEDYELNKNKNANPFLVLNDN